MVNAMFDIQASWLSDYNGGIYDDSRQLKTLPSKIHPEHTSDASAWAVEKYNFPACSWQVNFS